MSDYVQPVGEADPNAPYKDRNTGAGQPGSKVPALAIEMPQREIRTVLLSVGMTPNKTDPTQLNAAIDQKIALATAGGENPLDDLLTLLRARLPVFPEIKTADGRFNLSVPSTGTVRIPSGIVIQHRGVFPITTIEQDFATSPNKAYHLRYRFTGTPGWSLVDVADSGYNPGALPEANPAFDTGYDDMISHRVVTDASNVAVITALANLDRIRHFEQNNGAMTFNSGANAANRFFVVNHNYARTPLVTASVSLVEVVDGASDHDMVCNPVNSTNRYQTTVSLARDFATQMGANVLAVV
jgi:hypothetical protein